MFLFLFIQGNKQSAVGKDLRIQPWFVLQTMSKYEGFSVWNCFENTCVTHTFFREHQFFFSILKELKITIKTIRHMISPPQFIVVKSFSKFVFGYLLTFLQKIIFARASCFVQVARNVSFFVLKFLVVPAMNVTIWSIIIKFVT